MKDEILTIFSLMIIIYRILTVLCISISLQIAQNSQYPVYYLATEFILLFATIKTVFYLLRGHEQHFASTCSKLNCINCNKILTKHAQKNMKRTQALVCISLLLDDEEEDDENDYLKQKRTIWVKQWYRGLTQAVFLHLRLRHATLNISKNNIFAISHLHLVEGETEEVERWDRVKQWPQRARNI